MRLLHEVHPAEKLVSSGQYQYLIQGKPSGQVESWQITRLPNGTEVVRADVDGRDAAGAASLLTHIKRRSDGRPEWLRMRYGKGELSAAAQYTFEADNIHVARQIQGDVRRQEVVDIATGYEVDYHPVIAHDYVWRGYPDHARGKQWAIPIFSPDLWTEGERMLGGRSLRFQVTPLGPETCVTPIGEFEKARPFELLLSDGVKAMAWFDEFGIPLRWLYPEKGYDFVIVSYLRG